MYEAKSLFLGLRRGSLWRRVMVYSQCLARYEELFPHRYASHENCMLIMALGNARGLVFGVSWSGPGRSGI